MILVGIEQQEPGATVVPRKGDWVVWRTRAEALGGEIRMGRAMRSYLDPLYGLIFDAIEHYTQKVCWGYVANIEYIKGEKVQK